ncbi:MAG: transglycosylase SLT domain-containing protein [Pseudohongiellaceae bacterium]|jgi:hypothetical protein
MNHSSSINSVPGVPEVIPALRRASAATGVDFSFLLEQARTESSLNPRARASSSSARGLFQFIDSTWLDVIDRHGYKHGLDAAAAGITRDSKGRPVVDDAAKRAEILKLRDDPYISGLMAAELAQDNAAHLEQELGRDAKPAELYMAHFLGAGGAAAFLSGLEENPDVEASYIVPAAARANQAVFYKEGKALSLDEVYARFEGKFGGTAPLPAGAVPRLPVPATPVATPQSDTAAFAARAAILAARPTLQPTLQPIMQTGGPVSRVAAGLQLSPPANATAGPVPTPAVSLVALRLLQDLALPGTEEDDGRGRRSWRA